MSKQFANNSIESNPTEAFPKTTLNELLTDANEIVSNEGEKIEMSSFIKKNGTSLFLEAIYKVGERSMVNNIEKELNSSSMTYEKKYDLLLEYVKNDPKCKYVLNSTMLELMALIN